MPPITPMTPAQLAATMDLVADERGREIVQTLQNSLERLYAYTKRLEQESLCWGKYQGPDWPTAPAWATHWAVDATARAYYYDREVEWSDDGVWYMVVEDDDTAQSRHAGRITLPLGVDWRQTKQERPA